MRGFWLSMEAALSLAALALLLAAAHPPAPHNAFSPLGLTLAAGDVADVLLEHAPARQSLRAWLVSGDPSGLQSRLDAYAGALGVCLAISSQAGVLEAGCAGSGGGVSFSVHRALFAKAEFGRFYPYSVSAKPG